MILLAASPSDMVEYAGMKMTFTSHLKKGFTLIELLVVIAILATLAGISTPIIMGQMDAAKESAARKTCMDIVEGATRFRTDYGVLPYRANKTVEPSEENNYQVSLITADEKDADMLAILTNREDVDDEERMNINKDYYIRSDEQDKKVDGLYVDPSSGVLGLYDPWGKPYYVLMCEENEGCTDPFTGKQLRGKNCIAYSLGSDSQGAAPERVVSKKKSKKNKKNKKDKEAEEAASIEEEEAAEAIADNIYSWKKVSN